MARTNEAAVRLVLDQNTSLTSGQITAFIDDASAWLDENLLDKGYSTAMLEMIERYLACFFCALRDPQLMSSKIGDVAEAYQRGKVDGYLQRAIGFDPSGAIEDAFGGAAGRKRVKFRVASGYDSTLGLGVTEG